MDAQDADSVAMMLAEFDLEVQAKIERMRSVAEGEAVAIDNTFMVQMLKLPKKVRTLTMDDFCTKYAGDLKQVVDEQLRRVVDDLAQEEDAALALSAKRYNTMSRAAAKTNMDVEPGDSGKYNTWNDATRKASAKKARSLRSAQKAAQPTLSSVAKGAVTPAAAARPARALRSSIKDTPSGAAGASSLLPNFATPSAFGAVARFDPMSSLKTPRVAVLGEIAYSANGSPIGVPTVARATVKRNRPTAMIEVELEGGLAVDANAIASLPEDAREEALEKLRELQLQVNTLMSQFV
jgi:hypothetical protein